MSGTLKRTCTCTNQFMDERYGKNVRIYNITTSGARCTVCGNTVTLSIKNN